MNWVDVGLWKSSTVWTICHTTDLYPTDCTTAGIWNSLLSAHDESQRSSGYGYMYLSANILNMFTVQSFHIFCQRHPEVVANTIHIARPGAMKLHKPSRVGWCEWGIIQRAWLIRCRLTWLLVHLKGTISCPLKKTVNPETDNFRVKNFSGQNWVNDIIWISKVRWCRALRNAKYAAGRTNLISGQVPGDDVDSSVEHGEVLRTGAVGVEVGQSEEDPEGALVAVDAE